MKKKIGIFIIYLVLTLIFTYPLIFNMKSSFYGSPGDATGTIGWFWWCKVAWQKNISFRHCLLRAAPFGADYSKFLIMYAIHYPALFLSLLFNEVVAYNILVLAAFPLAAFFMYLLTYYITRHHMASFLSGLIYGFSAYIFAHAQGHISLTHIEWFPLYLFFLLRLNNTLSYKDGLFCALTFWICVLTDYYYAFFIGVLTLLFITFRVFFQWRVKLKNIFTRSLNLNKYKIIKTSLVIFFALAVVLCLTLPFQYSNIKSILSPSKTSAFSIYGQRPLKQLFFYSIKPLTFFLPSIYHPIFGPFTKGWIGSIFYGENPCEAALYLGFIPLILAAIAFKQWRRDKDYYKGFFIFLFLASILFTLPPYLKAGNFKILFPSYFMYRLIPLFRNPVRFGLITILSIAALAGIGLKIILTRIDLKRTRFLFVSVVIIGVLFEIINIPPFHVTDISKIPPVYKWLSEQKRDFAIAEYPLLRDPGVNGRYIFYQRIHKKPLVNGAGIADMEAYNIKKIIFRITDPRTPSTLSWLGAKYAIVHLEDLKKSESLDIIGVLPDLKKIKGLKFIKSFPGVEVYEVTAQPRKPNIE